MDIQSQTPHISILPTPGMGHLIPLIEFAKKIVEKHNFDVTFVIPSDGPPSEAQRSVLNSLPESIKHIFLPPVNLDDLPEDTKIETRISLTVVRSISSLHNVIKNLVETTNLVALVVDLFGTDGFDVSREFNVSSYIFFPSTAMALSLFLYLPTLDEMVSCEYRDMQELVKIPGCTPIHGRELLDPLQERQNEAYKWVLHHAKGYRMAEGIMVNSFIDLEPGPIKALQKQQGKQPIYPIGPLVKTCGSKDDYAKLEGSDLECMKWLDEQPNGSVLFVSFGSGGTISHEQLMELAFGLEMSEQRFLWVIKCPNKDANGMYFKVHDQMSPLDYLPQGYLNRIQKQGFLVASWAPQAHILSHSSTAAFLSHCGWNSSLESVVNGVPMITWPLFAEQKMNAVMLNEDVKVAIRPKVGENGIVGREDIARVVKTLMEGDEGKRLRNRMKELKEASNKVLGQDGSSTEALSQVAHKWKSHRANK